MASHHLTRVVAGKLLGAPGQTFLEGFIPGMMAVPKPESMNEVKGTVSQFGKGFTEPWYVVNVF
jgi:hypothetical protein